MSLTADQITIAITVYNRRKFLKCSIASALEQTVPARVIVVEDCGPDTGLQDFVKTEFGSRVQYVRNPRRRGLFGNWNACMELCQTPWLSILHDDDYLAPNFIEAMLELNRRAPDCGLYFGMTTIVDESGTPMPWGQLPKFGDPWGRVRLADTLEITPFPFPGQLFNVAQARAVGGFRETSLYAGDWEMWCLLIDHFGAAQSATTVAFNRQHSGRDRGTNKVVRDGRLIPLTYVQKKRILALLRWHGQHLPLDRVRIQERSPVPTRLLVRYGATWPPRLLAYHVGLLAISKPMHWRYWLFKTMARTMGPRFVRLISNVWNRCQSCRRPVPCDGERDFLPHTLR